MYMREPKGTCNPSKRHTSENPYSTPRSTPFLPDFPFGEPCTKPEQFSNFVRRRSRNEKRYTLRQHPADAHVPSLPEEPAQRDRRGHCASRLSRCAVAGGKNALFFCFCSVSEFLFDKSLIKQNELVIWLNERFGTMRASAICSIRSYSILMRNTSAGPLLLLRRILRAAEKS